MRSLTKMALMVVCVVAGPGAGQAGQPIRESLVECAVLVELLTGEQTPVPGQSGMLDLYAGAAVLMREEATRRGGAEYVAAVAEEKRVVWHDRWDAGGWDDPARREELVDWWTYCFKLADHLDLQLPDG